MFGNYKLKIEDQFAQTSIIADSKVEDIVNDNMNT